MSDNPKENAQVQAEQTFDQFIYWSKKVTLWSALYLAIVLFGCNNGVETGPDKTGSTLDGSAYAPQNLDVKKDH